MLTRPDTNIQLHGGGGYQCRLMRGLHNQDKQVLVLVDNVN